MLKLYTHAVAHLNSLRKDEEGVTAIEYGLIAGTIAVVIIGTLVIMGDDISSIFGKVSSALKDADSAGS